METSALYDKMEEENIDYVNAKLLFTRGAIVHCNNLTAIVVNDEQVKSQVSENTVSIQELGHYIVRCINYYYNQYNGFN